MNKGMFLVLLVALTFPSKFSFWKAIGTASASEHFSGILSLDVARGRWKSACDLLDDANIASMMGNAVRGTVSTGKETKTPVYFSHCIRKYGETRVDFDMEINTEGESGNAEGHSLEYQNEENSTGRNIKFEPVDILGPGAVWDPLQEQITVHHANGSMIKTKVYIEESKFKSIAITEKLLPLVRITIQAHWKD